MWISDGSHGAPSTSSTSYSEHSILPSYNLGGQRKVVPPNEVVTNLVDTASSERPRSTSHRGDSGWKSIKKQKECLRDRGIQSNRESARFIPDPSSWPRSMKTVTHLNYSHVGFTRALHGHFFICVLRLQNSANQLSGHQGLGWLLDVPDNFSLPLGAIVGGRFAEDANKK
ncbi:hypothetical protein BDR05DRAFT_1038422 [Suillus weaverae]|nr:hypothetical protein BDR05DRAFT_1038422 [Suillus weaverae]